MLDKRKNPHTGKEEYCLVSISNGRVLEWYGAKRPSDKKLKGSEGRVNYFKNKS